NFMGLHADRLACRPGEIAHPAGLPDEEPRLVVEDHLHHDVTGIQLSLGHTLLAPLGLGDLFGGDDDLAEIPFEALAAHAAHDIVANRLLAVALHLQNVPLQLLSAVRLAVAGRRSVVYHRTTRS